MDVCVCARARALCGNIQVSFPKLKVKCINQLCNVNNIAQLINVYAFLLYFV